MKKLLLLVICLIGWGLVPAEAQILCQDCWHYSGPLSQTDASCCISGGTWCDALQDRDGAFLERSNTSDCYVDWFGSGYRCNGTNGSCLNPWGSPGGGEDGDPCTLRFGQLCPAQCGWCVYYY